MAKKRKIEMQKGSGNLSPISACPIPEQELLKAHLTLQIYRIVKAARADAGAGGRHPRHRRPHVSALMRNRAGNFSVGRLMEFLTALGQDVRITVTPTRKAKGEMAVWLMPSITNPS